MGGLSHTVSGDIASFRTPSRVPIESLKFHFLPKQAAGTPSPENPIPIEGWTGLTGRRCHKNIIKPYYSAVTVRNGLTITPTTNGIRISGTAESRTPCFICTTDNIKLGVGDKVAFSLYVNGDISECENPFLGYYKSIGVWGSVIYSFSSSSNWNHTIWTVPDTYTDVSYIDSYIYIPQGVTVNFEIGLQGIISSYYSDDYEPYSEEQIPITFPDGQTIYGGYVDPVAGEIVAEKVKIIRKVSNMNNSSDYPGWKNTGIKEIVGGGYNAAFSDITSIGNGSTTYAINTQGVNDILYVPKSSYGMTQEEWIFNYPNLDIEFIIPIANPIHIPITPQDLKAFLDHNNLWSDANDITEVIYAVTESKDILATRKKAMEFDMGHRRKVRWNQKAPSLSLDNWQPYNSPNSISVDGDEMTITYNEVSSTSYKNSIYTKGTARTSCIQNHKYYFSYLFCPSWNTYAIGFSILNMNSPVYPNATANNYTRASGICELSNSSALYNIMIAYSGWDAGWSIGDTVKCKSPIMIDLTAMFGEGNEPTQTEFEKICAINGIDLTLYHPIDTGSDRWLIVP